MSNEKETLSFQTETKQILHLMIHALYSNKEIFLRELISNASDAADKLRFEALSNPGLLGSDPELKVIITFDKAEKTLTISDNGIGMSREEVVNHLGTIAKSGTKEFLSSLSGDQAKDANLIGQFGVGFYSAFIVADKVTVITLKAGLPSDQSVEWISAGEGDYTIENTTKSERGTTIILHLRADDEEFLDAWRLKTLIRKYSDHITLPVLMPKEAEKETEDAEKSADEYETVNKATALWTLPRTEISNEQYDEFYKYLAHDFENPLTWGHNRVEGKQEYISLLYIPAHAPFDLYSRDKTYGLKLYIKRVFIMDDAEQFLPNYLRFVKGVIDSSDLPLNISREILQSNKLVDSMKSALTKRVLGMLEKLQQEHPDKYTKFWKEFGNALKEGIVEDIANKEAVAKLLRFASTHENTAEQNVTLDDYIQRMKPEQDKIYFITAETFNAAKSSPHLEIFRQKGIEVLLLSDRIDEWVGTHLTEYNGKALQSVMKADLKLDENEEKTSSEKEELNKDFESVIKQMKQVLGDAVKDVRLSNRLTTSPACLVVDENDLNPQLQRILKQAGQAIPESKPILEINPKNRLILRLQHEQDDHKFTLLTDVLFGSALLAEGGTLTDPGSFVNNLNQVLMES
jgi:molecular chaperone HtpG